MIPRGHAPAYLRDMFCAALAYGVSHESWWEWFGTENADQFLWRERDGGRWSKLDAKERAAWVAGQLVNSIEVMPDHLLLLLGLEPGQTYAEVARRLRAQVDPAEIEEERLVGDAGGQVLLQVEIPEELMDRLTMMSERMGFSLDDAVRHAIAEWLR